MTNKKTDWEGFRVDREDLIDLQVPLRLRYQLEEELGSFITNLQKPAWNNTPMIHRRRIGSIYSFEIYELINKNRRARKKWQCTRSPRDKNKLNQVGNDLKRKLKEFKNENISKFLWQLIDDKDTDYSLWKVTKGIKRPKTQIPPIKKDNRTWARNRRRSHNCLKSICPVLFSPSQGRRWKKIY